MRAKPPPSLRLAVGLAAALSLTAARPGEDRAAARAAFTRRLVAAAVARARVKVRYVADYVRIPYPGGDVPLDTGVCADEVIRVYRTVGHYRYVGLSSP